MITEPRPPRFAVDAMLGRLARWLRVLGHDTIYDPAMHDHTLVQVANEEDRMLLTRDRHLLRELRPNHSLEITSDVPLEQLHGVIMTLGLEAPAELFTRCLVCNAELSAPLPSEEAARVVPPDAAVLPGPVRRCPSCGRVYWPGSHVRRMRHALARALPGWLPAEG